MRACWDGLTSSARRGDPRFAADDAALIRAAVEPPAMNSVLGASIHVGSTVDRLIATIDSGVVRHQRARGRVILAVRE